MTLSVEFSYIQTQDQLNLILDELVEREILFLDTEFIKRNTYYPILGLVQINIGNTDIDDTDIGVTDSSCYVIDAVSLDLTEFWRVLFSVELLVMHACSEDVDLLVQEASKAGIKKQLPPVFDTQIGLSFLNYGLQISYQKALEELLNVKIDKGESCSDWLARPLREEQIRYAVNDVVYLPKLFEVIKQSLIEKPSELNLYDCALADTQALCDAVLHQYSDDDIYLEWADFRYKPKQLAQLQSLCRWREQTARADNIPRTFIIKKSSLRDIIYQQPNNKKELSYIKDFRASNLKKYGDTILQCLHDLSEEAEFPKRILRPYKEAVAKEPEEKGLSLQLQELVNETAKKLNIPAEVLMRKRWRSRLYEQVALFGGVHQTFSISKEDAHSIEIETEAQEMRENLNSYITGWRYDLLIQPMLQLINQQYSDVYAQIIPREQQDKD